MEPIERFKKAVEYLKTKAETPTNEGVSKLLKYKTLSYVSDVIGGSKPLSDFILERLVEFSINTDWIKTGKGNMLVEPKNSQDKNYAVLNYVVFTTASGKTINVLPEGETEITLLNALLEERDRVLEERNRIIEKVEAEKQARIDELIKEKDNLNNILQKYLQEILANSKEISEDFDALTTEIQAEHRAMMDSIDVAAKQKIGTTRAKAGTAEIASVEQREKMGKKVASRK